ncbi:MAG: TonB-dependent receptor [Bacteroidales bacterium]|nr:TonB-dependent receptor [Bacteroidales bacterium]
MPINKFAILVFGLSLSAMVWSQSLDTLITLQEVQVIAEKEQYLIGSKIETLDSVKLNSVLGGSLTEILNLYLPIYIKQDAGGLATIRFRGTSPNHTAILFNGININSLTLGHSNLSNIPIFLFDEVKIQYGSSSSLYGSDAIGGSIYLGNNPEWDKGYNVGVQQDIASFGSCFSGLKLGYSNKKVKYSIKLFYQKKRNNFPFLNTAVRDFEKNEFAVDTQKNAALSNYGVLQELYLKISDKMFYYLKLWYEDNWHQIQPNMSANYYGGSFKEIQNKHLRLISGFKYYSGKHKLTTDFGYINDYQLYDKNDEQLISTNSLIANLNYFNTRFLNGNLNTGVNYTHIKPDVYAYNGNIEESRIDIFSSYKRELIPRMSMALNLRESIVSDYKSQFSPSLGLDYLFVNSSNQTLHCKFSVSHSYKIPTFNDRYWYPNGNPDLLSEKGMNYEFNTKYEFTRNKNSFHIGLTGFLMEVDNWIQWVNLDIWRPRNIKKVQNKGIELHFENTVQISGYRLNSGINYSLTKAIEVKSYHNQSTSTGKQLIYTPRHIGNAFITLDYRKWYLLTTASYTGERFNESYKTLDGYFLLNTSLGKNFHFKKNIISVNFKVNNLLNKAYQNQELYAMPGRNYAVSIKYSITRLKFKQNEKD